MTAHEILEILIETLKLHTWSISLNVLSSEDYQTQHGIDFSFETDGCTTIDDVNMVAEMFMKDTLNGEEIKDFLIHECVHLVTHPYDSFVRDTVEVVTPKKVGRVLANNAMWAMEVNVCRFSCILKALLERDGSNWTY
jgi:hypothetical protein